MTGTDKVAGFPDTSWDDTDYSFYPQNTPGFIAVTDVVDMPTDAFVGVPLTLTGTVVPDDADNKTLVWNTSATGATVTGSVFTATIARKTWVSVIVENGIAPGVDFVKQFEINVSSVAPSITTASLPDGVVGTAYSQTLAATGTQPITWNVIEGTLPAGLTLDGATGVISGTPTAAAEGTASFTVVASNGTHPNDTATLTIKINAAPVAPIITTVSLPSGVVGTAYSQTLAATGTQPIDWSITGILPDGLTLADSTGVISGTPTAAGTRSFTVTASNGTLPDAVRTFTITISTAPVAPIINTVSLPGGVVGRD